MRTPTSAGVDADKDLTKPSANTVHPSGTIEALCDSASAASGTSISSTLYNIAESLVRMRLSTSKVRTFAASRPKTVIGWPLHQPAVPAQL